MKPINHRKGDERQENISPELGTKKNKKDFYFLRFKFSSVIKIFLKAQPSRKCSVCQDLGTNGRTSWPHMALQTTEFPTVILPLHQGMVSPQE